MKKSILWISSIVAVLAILGIILANAPKKQKPNTEVFKNKPSSGQIAEDLRQTPKGQDALVGDQENADKEMAGEEQNSSKTVDVKKSNEKEQDKHIVNISVSPRGFKPNEFSVKSGDIVSILLTSTEQTHVLKFDSLDLQKYALGVGSNETRQVSFKAPSKGDYSFYCDVPGHRGRGETGVMHVK